MIYKIVVVSLLLVVLLVSGSSCVQIGGVAPRAELAILKKELTKDAAGKTVCKVTIKNVSDVTAELASVKVNFYDAQKELIDSNKDSIMNLKPNTTWDFILPCTTDRCNDIKSYDVEVMSGSSSGGL